MRTRHEVVLGISVWLDLGRHIRPAGHRRPLICFGGLMDAFFCPAEEAILSSDVAWEVATINLKGSENEQKT